MKIYLDLVFIENFIMDFILIYHTYILTNQKKSILRYIIASLLGAFYTVVCIYLKQSLLNIFLLKILLSFTMVYIAFLPKKVLILLKEISLFYLISFVYTGIITVICQIFNIKTNTTFITILVYIIGLIGLMLITKYQKSIFKVKALNKNLIYNINFNIGNSTFEYSGLVDTGNSVKDSIYGYNVIFIDKNEELKTILSIEKIRQTEIITKSINNITKNTGYIIENCYFKNNKEVYNVKNIVIVFAEKKLNKDNNFDALIGINTYLDNLGGMLL